MRVIIARNISPDIMPVTNRGEIAKDLSVPEDRLHKPEIREVRTAVVGIIETSALLELGKTYEDIDSTD